MTQAEIIADLWRAVEIYRTKERREEDLLIAATAQGHRLLCECQSDCDEYAEEMSIGGRPYGLPHNYGRSG